MPSFKVEMENCSEVTINSMTYPILVNYLRKSAPKSCPTTSINGKRRGRPFGVIVAIDKDKIGWSICHNVDKWSREVAIKRAAGRAMKGVSYWLTEFRNYTAAKGTQWEEYVGDVTKSGLPKLIAVANGLEEMLVRASKYFKYESGT